MTTNKTPERCAAWPGLAVLLTVVVLGGCAPTGVGRYVSPVTGGARPKYLVHVPPGETVTITLPALCLNYSKKTPRTFNRFRSIPSKPSPQVRRLMTIFNLMLAKQAVFRKEIAKVPAIRLLAKEHHSVLTESGARRTFSFMFRDSLLEALQYAIWRHDPKFLEASRKNLVKLRRKLVELRRKVFAKWQSYETGRGISPSLRRKLARIRRMGRWAELKRLIRGRYELLIILNNLRIRRMAAIAHLSVYLEKAADQLAAAEAGR